jgi:tRNA dimethylallyltransferase
MKDLKKTVPEKTLVVLNGPTAVGKTELCIRLAEELHTSVISGDARQFYRELTIGTAPPSRQELMRVPHYFVGHLSIHDYYNVSLFEQDALRVLETLFRSVDVVLATGGSGLYMDTLCHGIDALPEPDRDVRNQVRLVLEREGLDGLRSWVHRIDPAYYAEADLSNPKRLMRAIEVFLSCGVPYSRMRRNQPVKRPFAVKQVVVNRDRDELFCRINQRVDHMVRQGLVEEAWRLYPWRHLNALNTVGYKELYDWIAGRCTLSQAIGKIKTNTRRYAKRQLTWYRKKTEAAWFHPGEEEAILAHIRS